MAQAFLLASPERPQTSAAAAARVGKCLTGARGELVVADKAETLLQHQPQEQQTKAVAAEAGAGGSPATAAEELAVPEW